MWRRCASPPTDHGVWQDRVAAQFGCATLLCCAVVLGSIEGAEQAAGRARPLVVDDPLSVLVPRTPRAEQDRDRVDAAALYAAGRLLEQAGRHAELQAQTASAVRSYSAALRKYQRAFRRDDQPGVVLHEIIALAQATDRRDEAVRYAIRAVEQDPSDSVLTRWLALCLTDQGDWQRALELYERLVAEAGQAAADGRSESAASIAIWAEVGRLAYLIEDYTKASKAFLAVESALTRPVTAAGDRRTRALLLSNARATYQLFGEAHLAAGRPELAEAAFRRGHEGDAGEGLLEYHLARVAQRQNRPELALRRLQTYFQHRLATAGTAPYRLLADLLADLNQTDTLVTRLESLHGTDPDNVPLACFLAAQYVDRSQLAEAEAIYQRVLTWATALEEPAAALDGGDGAGTAASDRRATSGRQAAGDWLGDALGGLITVYRQRRDVPALVRILARAAQRADWAAALQEELAQIVADRGLLDAVVEHAEAWHADVDKTAPPGAALALAHLALAADRIALAAQYFQRAVERQPDRAAAILLGWGIAVLEAEDYEAAVEVFQRGIDRGLGPKDDAARAAYQAGLHFYQAGALALLGATDRAVGAARRAVALQPDSALIASREPWIASRAGQSADAIAGYTQLINTFDMDHHDQTTRAVLRAARFELSHLCVLAGDLPAAEEWLEQVLDEDPENIGALNDLGFLWVDQGAHLGRALGMIKKAVAAEPGNVAYLDSLGWAHFRLANYDVAVGHLERAAAGANPDGVILDHLGDCYQQLGQLATARQTWQRAVTAFEAQGRAAEAARVQEKIDHAPVPQPPPPPDHDGPLRQT